MAWQCPVCEVQGHIASLYCCNHLLIPDDDDGDDDDVCAVTCSYFPDSALLLFMLQILQGKKIKMYQEPGFRGVLYQGGV